MFPATDEISIQLFTGDSIRVQGLAAGGSADPLIELFDPSGTSVTFDDDALGLPDAEFTFTVVDNGQHKLSFTSVGGNPADFIIINIFVN